ncbi:MULTISPECIES: rhodanese-like domain-containing protein [Paenarthrobacter]|uniref:rhodanese-like domain-containing protein n=1 Tax=Paenarthrobacter TaxID=1742992 RepID=UPI002D1E4657|nr:rhodanese-like domain-containing protein [Paenarthrobacter ureafaciens]
MSRQTNSPRCGPAQQWWTSGAGKSTPRPGSLNIPLEELSSRLADLPNTTLYLLCGPGKRSSQAARILTDRGHTTVNVAGGIT